MFADLALRASGRRPKPRCALLGRDELNLAEFPLAVLSDRAPRNRKTLVFEDSIWDKGLDRQITRRLTITGSEQFGLPTALDDEVILGLIQLSKGSGFASRMVGFSRYRLIDLLGWRREGRSYRRLDESLKRWLGVTLYYENAWWDKQDKKWVDAHFHLLEYVVLSHGPRVSRSPDFPVPGGDTCSWANRSDPPLRESESGDMHGRADTADSHFSWNPIVFRSFQAGYLKQLDMEVYRRLKLPTSKRMYRFLDKKFHFSRILRFDLRRFACEHIGLSRAHDAAQLRRKLVPALSELETIGVLAPLCLEERFRRLGHGVWEIVFLKRNAKRPSRECCVSLPRPGNSEAQVVIETGFKKAAAAKVLGCNALAVELIRRGVTQAVALRLARDHDQAMIREKIGVFDLLAQRRDPRVSRNPAGYLVQSIREDYRPPVAIRPASSPRARPKPASPARRPRRSEMTPREEPSEVQRYLAGLSLEQLVALEDDAVAAAPVIMSDGYRRANRDGNKRIFEDYRNQILSRHVARLLAASPEKAGPLRA